MAYIFGKELTKNEILDRVGSIDAIAGVRQTELCDGRGRGTRVYDVVCGRLRFAVYIDKCMDIGELYFDGMPLHFLARPGVMGNQYWYDAPNAPRSITGGMMFTCGLNNVGPAQEIDGGIQPQHGYIRTTPAANHGARAFWQGDDYFIELFGEMREAKLFGENMTLRRTITVKLGDCSISLSDQIENQSSHESPLMLMYHCNAGYPLLDENARLVVSANSTVGRDAIANNGMLEESPFVFGAPVNGYDEQVFYHKLNSDGGRCRATLVNAEKRLAFTIDFDQKELPYLIHWKCRASGDYVTGIEPSNCHPEGVIKERENGTLRILAPRESIQTSLRFSISSGDEVAAI